MQFGSRINGVVDHQSVSAGQHAPQTATTHLSHSPTNQNTGRYVPPHKKSIEPPNLDDGSNQNDWNRSESPPRREGKRSFPRSHHDNSFGRWGGGGPRGPNRVTMQRNARLEAELFTQQHDTKTAIDFDKYADIPVEVNGNSIPEPAVAFDQLDVHDVLKSNIGLAGYTTPTPVQKYATVCGLTGRDLMACAQTGSGKTCAFLLPIIANLIKQVEASTLPSPRPPPNRSRRPPIYPYALILTPTRELTNQIYKEAAKFTYRTGIRPVVVYGGVPIGPQLRDLERGCEMLVATPGRLVDILERSRVSLSLIQQLVLDEADQMLDLGFEPQIRQIIEKYGMSIDNRQTAMFSATFPRDIQRLAQDFLNDHIFLAVGRVGSATENITQKVYYTADEKEKHEALLDVLSKAEGLTLIFVETKRSADTLEYWLVRQGLDATSIHGDRSQEERERALADFRHARCNIMVATSVAARGLDIPNVMCVVNYDVPANIDEYVHRIGRTGRAGHRGEAVAFIDASTKVLRDMYNVFVESKQLIEPWFEKLVKYSGYGGRGHHRQHSNNGGRFGGRDYRNENGNWRNGGETKRSNEGKGRPAKDVRVGTKANEGKQQNGNNYSRSFGGDEFRSGGPPGGANDAWDE